MRFNRARSHSSCIGIVEENALTLFSSGETLSPICRFRCFASVRCFGLSSRCLVVFEDTDNRLTVLEQREEDLTKWHAIFRRQTTWLASDCSVFSSGNEITVVAGSVVGAHVFSFTDRSSAPATELVFASRSLACVCVRRHCMALAALDGHVAFRKRRVASAEEREQVAWFCESGQRVTGIELCDDELLCAVVCWDGSGVLLAPANQAGRSDWAAIRLLSPPALLASVPRARMCNAAFGAFSGKEKKTWCVFFNGGLKQFDDDGTVQWISKEEDAHIGFCGLDEARMVVVLEGNRIRIVSLSTD